MGISSSKQARTTTSPSLPATPHLSETPPATSSHHAPLMNGVSVAARRNAHHHQQQQQHRAMTTDHDPDCDTGEMIQLFMYNRCPRAIVHHYIPANLPMMPIFTEAYLSDCNNTWKYILSSSTDRMKEFKKSGIVLFYDEFFFRLFQRDSTFKEVFPDIRRRGEILIKALTLMLKSCSDDNARLVNKIRYLGHRHRFFPKIRAFQFATYTSTMIEVLMYWLGELATPDVAEAWSNVVCFFMKHMLESFLTDRVDPFESYQNTVIEHARALSELDEDDKKGGGPSAIGSNGSRGSRASRASVILRQVVASARGDDNYRCDNNMQDNDASIVRSSARSIDVQENASAAGADVVTVETLTRQLEQRDLDLYMLQKEHDDYVASSCEIERELEAEVSRLEKINSKLVDQLRRVSDDVDTVRAASDAAGKELSKLHSVIADVTKANAALKVDVQRLEQRNDDLERRERELHASIDDLEHQLDVSMEQAVFLRQENDEIIARVRDDHGGAATLGGGTGASVNPLSMESQVKYGTDATKSSATSPPMSPKHSSTRQRSAMYVTTATATCGPSCAIM
ncbi:hypothetical protein DYB26_010290 [Aphanomyces astaci]|uniref:Globin domain-containing protein n=2 Tax=Aphanomyces astaci TaxID=112090 RepID=A0A397EW62_APHAT|nr:hypothetical protein DYB31_007991 [Aphanomyces astaci]RHZ32517.1 hypothetical protein DYB26_010290 [Aphanomyces astaci]